MIESSDKFQPTRTHRVKSKVRSGEKGGKDHAVKMWEKQHLTMACHCSCHLVRHAMILTSCNHRHRFILLHVFSWHFLFSLTYWIHNLQDFSIIITTCFYFYEALQLCNSESKANFDNQNLAASHRHSKIQKCHKMSLVVDKEMTVIIIIILSCHFMVIDAKWDDLKVSGTPGLVDFLPTNYRIYRERPEKSECQMNYIFS